MSDVNVDWNWPGGAQVAVSFTFDVDAEAPYVGMDSKYSGYLSTLSAGRFGVTRGMPRILALFREHDMPASFYIPGETVRRHAWIVDAILSGGHEIAHHGDLHKPVHTISAQQQLDEMEGGLAALEAAGAPRPTGYRSPSWEMTPETFRLVCERRFLYDSSFMGDDRPYFESWNGQEILELPVTWTLDDWPLLGWSPHFPSAKLGSPDLVFAAWLAEYREARAERRHVSFTMHPEVIGRSSRFALLRQLVETIAADQNVWVATMEDVAKHAATILAKK